MKIDKKAPAATVDVAAADDMNQHSCNRCGKYRKQCGVSPRKLDNLPACPRMKYNNSFGSLSTEPMIKCKRNDFFKTILQCFSLRYSWRRICNRNLTNRNLSAIHGLKVISTFWMIFVHVTLTVFYVSGNYSPLPFTSAVNKLSTRQLYVFAFIINNCIFIYEYWVVACVISLSFSQRMEMMSINEAQLTIFLPRARLLSILCFLSGEVDHVLLLRNWIYFIHQLLRYVNIKVYAAFYKKSIIHLYIEKKHGTCSKCYFNSALNETEHFRLTVAGVYFSIILMS